MAILAIVVIVLGTLFLVVSHSKKEGTGKSWVQFYAKGREAGFSFKEIEMLRQLAAQTNLEYPTSLYESQVQLDRCIHSLVRGIKISGGGEDQGIQDFLSKLYDYRKKTEMNASSIKNRIANSRQIKEGQRLRILVTGMGVSKSQVVKNAGQYMTISRPVNNKKGSTTMAWTGTRISVYFWREDDAGYVFDSEVLDEVFSLGTPSLKITHSDSLFRTQKRKSIRIKMHKAAFLYLVSPHEPAHKLEIDPGLKCFLEDISDTGCAISVGGKADTGIRVKVQFALNNAAICMTGMVRSMDFKEESNRSILHIEAESLPVEIRNRIMGEIFGMLPDEDDEELPLRFVDDSIIKSDAGDDTAGGESFADSAISEGTAVDVSTAESIMQETNGI